MDNSILPFHAILFPWAGGQTSLQLYKLLDHSRIIEIIVVIVRESWPIVYEFCYWVLRTRVMYVYGQIESLKLKRGRILSASPKKKKHFIIEKGRILRESAFYISMFSALQKYTHNTNKLCKWIVVVTSCWLDLLLINSKPVTHHMYHMEYQLVLKKQSEK